MLKRIDCSNNKALETLNIIKGKAEDAIASATNAFNQMENSISNLVSSTIGNIESVVDGVVGELNTAISDVKSILKPVVNLRTKLFDLLNASQEEIDEFLIKWESRISPELAEAIRGGPIILARYLATINFCKDIPNLEMDEETGEIIDVGPELYPSSESPERESNVEISSRIEFIEEVKEDISERSKKTAQALENFRDSEYYILIEYTLVLKKAHEEIRLYTLKENWSDLLKQYLSDNQIFDIEKNRGYVFRILEDHENRDYVNAFKEIENIWLKE